MKQPHLVFFDEHKSISDDLMDAIGSMLSGHKSQFPPIMIPDVATEAHKSKGMTATQVLRKARGSNASILGDALLDAFSTGHGLSEICFDNLEKLAIRNMRGSSKPMWPAMFTMAEADKHTVKYDLKVLQTAQTSNGPGKDPLFEAMDKHNQLIKLGRKAIHEMFHARPLNLNQKTPGPYKAKDWE